MNSPQIRLAKPYIEDLGKVYSLFEEILKSGFLMQGRFVPLFEEMIAQYLNIKHAIAVNSGTSALHLSLLAVGIGPGDEVIVPAYTFPATVNVVEIVGAKPVLVDVDLDTYNISIQKIQESISPSTKAIIPVHLFGNPADMDPIMEIAEKHKLWVIEDSAGALGSTYKARKCGTIGHLGCFSFHPRKLITTGEGGMVVTNDDILAERIRSLRNHGIEKKNNIDFVVPGFNFRMSELQAALGVAQMKEIDKMIEERRQLAGFYQKFLREMGEIVLQKVLPSSTSVWQAFVVRLIYHDNSQIIKDLSEHNIESTIGTYAIHMLSFYRKKYGFKPDDFPNAYELYIRNLALPFYNGLSLEDMQKVADTLGGILNGNRTS
jgi:dTDP-4-amino-4,6-dideoxygalactose transaminase